MQLAYYPYVFVDIGTTLTIGGWSIVKAMLKTLFRHSKISVHLYDGHFLFPVATKRLPHTLQRCWTL